MTSKDEEQTEKHFYLSFAAGSFFAGVSIAEFISCYGKTNWLVKWIIGIVSKYAARKIFNR